ncbi:MAG TPA: hypothetical protein VL069_00255 [Opitutus sp.]|nr:hypothetical protein [Opitutus sp.]
MKNKLFRFISLLALLGVLAVPSVRSEAAAKEKPVGKRTLAKYDTNKDGVLSAEERAVWDADKAKAKAARKAKKDGQKSAAASDSE